MKFLRRLFLFCAALCVAPLFHPAGVQGAITVGSASPDMGAQFPSFAMVGGRPAMAWADFKTRTIKYARAANATGTAWEPPVSVRSAPFAEPGGPVLRVANGNPAVCYHDAVESSLVFVRATDAAGSAWGEPGVLRASGFQFTMEIVNGVPAVLYSAGGMRLVMATDSNGSSWGPARIVETIGFAGSPTLVTAQGNPAVFYGTASGGLFYRRATDPDGTAWSPRINLSTEVTGGFTFRNISAQIVDGAPCVAWGESFPVPALKFVRATNATGTAWGTPVLIENSGTQPSLAVVNGRPAIGYYSGSLSELKFVHATSSSGATDAAWGPRVTVDSNGTVGYSPTLLEISGRPGLTYTDTTRGSVKYLRSVDASSAVWPADLLVKRPDTTDLLEGDTLSFGVVTAGATQDLVLSLNNPNSGSAALTIQSVTLSGPDAAEFSIPSPPAATTLTAGTGTPFTVRCNPLAPGIKSAVLRVISNAEGESNPCEIRLHAVTGPDIFVEVVDTPANTAIEDGGPLRLPLTAPGRSIERVFNIRNVGSSRVDLQACKLEYSIVSPK